MPENIAENTENAIENNQDKTESVSETNSMSNTQERSYESNAFYEMTSFFEDCIEDLPINIEDIKKFAHNPQIHIKNIRKICRWAYYENGSVMTSINYLKTMFTLDKVVYSKSKTKRKKKFENARQLMQQTLDTIRYKEVIRDNLFNDMIEGMDFKYFEITKSVFADKYLDDIDTLNIVEINELGIKCAVINLPVDYCRIVGRKNGSPIVAFDLRYFDDMAEDDKRRKLQAFPREIREAYSKYSTHNNIKPWKVLNNDNTMVTKINCKAINPYGVPLMICALDDVLYADYFTSTKRNVLDQLNNQIIYQTFPEAKDGRCTLTESQQKNQHKVVKEAITTRQNKYGKSFFSLAAGTKLNDIKVDTSIFDEKNENANKSKVPADLGIASSVLDGNSTGNYAVATLNLELVAGNVYDWINMFIMELNKCINANIIKDKKLYMECAILPVTFVNRDKQVKYMTDLYARGKGSLTAWIASTGWDSDVYLSLMDYELDNDWENKYPTHKTSYTMSSKDSDPSDADHSNGGRTKVAEKTNENSIMSENLNGNAQPKPSTTN
jgi:hypothetical protein